MGKGYYTLHTGQQLPMLYGKDLTECAKKKEYEYHHSKLFEKSIYIHLILELLNFPQLNAPVKMVYRSIQTILISAGH